MKDVFGGIGEPLLFFVAERTDDLTDAVQNRMHVKRLVPEGGLPAFDPGEIEHIVDQAEQVLAAGMNVADVGQIA